MKGKYFILGYLLVKVMALVCKADGEPGLLGGFVMISNGSREEESVSEEKPHTEEECRGYFDVMGQWDPPFFCKTKDYLYCCGTCGFRFCCSYKHSRLNQSTCTNYDTPVWMKTGQTPFKKMNKLHDSTKDKTNLIVYIICGVVAIMALVGIFTKLGLEKAHRPQRENMSRLVSLVLQGGAPGEQFRGKDPLGMHSQHYVAKATNLQGSQIHNNNMGPAGAELGQQHAYPALSQLADVYEHHHHQQQQQQHHQHQLQQPCKEINKYASLKAVAAKYNGELYQKQRLMVELPSKGGLPLQPMGTLRPAMGTLRPSMGTLSSMGMSSRTSGTNLGSGSGTMGHPLAYSSHTMGATRQGTGLGALKGWDGTETVGRRKSYGHKRPQCTVLEQNQLHGSRTHSHSQHFLPTQAYYVTNSKTEVTV
ncbi:unnamed protein product [Lota lota]